MIHVNLLGAVEVYDLRLKNKLKQFPADFWSSKEGFENAREIMSYLFEKRLKWSTQDVKNKGSKKVFIDNRLQGMLQILFNGSPFHAFDFLYPNTFKPWDFGMSINGYWTKKENCIYATKWLFEEKLKWSHEEIKKNIKKSVFMNNNLGGLLNSFNGRVFDILEETYPGKLKRWEISKMNKWDSNKALESTKWLIEEKLKLSIHDVKKTLTQRTFTENGLGGMLNKVYSCSPYLAIKALYGDKIKPWDLKTVPQGYWNDMTAKEATIWLIEEFLNWDYERILENIKAKTFQENNLRGLLMYFKNSPYLVLKNAYPEKDWTSLVSKYHNSPI